MKKITTRIIRWALGEQLKTILYYVFILIHLYHIICVGGGDPEICEMWPNPPLPFSTISNTLFTITEPAMVGRGGVAKHAYVILESSLIVI